MNELDTDPASRRTCERVDVNLPGRVIIQGRPPLNCIVRNMSEDGALLEFKAAIWLPPRFHVEVPALDTEAYCEIRHQRSNRVGVTFIRVTVHDDVESDDEAEARRTADHWDTAEQVADRRRDEVEMEHDLESAPAYVPARAPARGANQSRSPEQPVDEPTARRGSQIRQSVSVANRAPQPNPARRATQPSAGAKNWRERLLGR